MEKAYNRQNFVNNTAPDLNEDNINKIDRALNEIDNRVIVLHTGMRSALEEEKVRVNNELMRETFEAERQKAESERQAAELSRKRDEIARINAESVRIANEIERIEQEKLREKTIERAKDAAFKASAAAYECESAIEAAENYESNARKYYIAVESLTHGGTGTRENEETDNAEFYKGQSELSSVKAESLTHGGTGTRENEETDNAMFYRDQSQKNCEIAKEYLLKIEKAEEDAIDKINDAISNKLPTFYVDQETMDLHYEGGRFDFSLTEGMLEVEISI